MKTSKLLYFITISFCLFLFIRSANATHVIGGEITYTCVGANQYDVQLSLYRDCSGINLPTTVAVTVSGCNTQTVTLTRLSGYPIDISPLCPGNTSACNGGGGAYGIEQSIYQGTLTLPTGCINATLSYSICCRSTVITNINAPGTTDFYVEATIDNSLSVCNNSTNFLNTPTMVACLNQPFYYNQGGIDYDGDSLVYSLVNCRSDGSSTVSYMSGFNAMAPLSTSSGISIDPSTGAISFTPTAIEVGVLCVLVEEFRNGTKIAETVRDLQVTIINCPNNTPALTGADSTSSYSANFDVGVNNCFTIYSTDTDTGQTTFVSWNTAIAGANFTVSGSPNQQGVFCWTPTLADTGTHTFTVRVMDNGCPFSLTQTYVYTIHVSALTSSSHPERSPEAMNFRLYPSPVNDELNIDFVNATSEESHLTIVNLQGQVLQTKFISSHTQNIRLDASNLSAGLHIALLRDNSGNVLATRKFVVQ